MPVEAGYDPKVAPRRTAAMPLESADDYGAGIGRGIGQLGQALHRGEVTRFEIQERAAQDRELADVNARFAEARAAYDNAEIDARANAGPGGAGHAEAMAEKRRELRATLTNGLAYQDVKDRVDAQFAAWDGDADNRAYAWQVTAQVAKAGNDLKLIGAASANRIRTSPDPAAAYTQETLQLDDTINGFKNLSADQKADYRRALQGQGAIAYLDAVEQRNPGAAIALIDGGAFNDILDPDQLDRARRSASVEQRSQAAVAQAQISHDKAEARETINTAQKQLDDGVPMPDADIEKLQALAKQYGLEGEVYDLGKLRIVNEINRETKASRPIDFTRAITKLDEKIAAAGDQAQAADIIARDHMISRRDKRRASLNNDPLGYGAEIGRPVAPLEFDKPGSVTARVQTAEAIAKETGAAVQYLQPDEAEALRDRMNTGGMGGKLEVMAALAQFGGRKAIMAARQVSPTDTVMHRLVSLPPRYRQLALNGAEALKGNAQLVKAPDPNMKVAFDTQDAAIRTAFRAVNAGEANSAIDTAGNIMAGLMQAGSPLTAADRWAAINMALGGSKTPQGVWRGGLGTWNGQPFLLPDHVSQIAFEASIARRALNDPARAPVNPDGSRVDLKRAFPVAIGPGRYRWETRAGGVVRARDGSVFTMTVEARQ